jgi:hypothetical protein
MANYLLHYTLPVLIVLVLLVLYVFKYRSKADAKRAIFSALGFLLGWASAYLSLYIFHLYK